MVARLASSRDGSPEELVAGLSVAQLCEEHALQRRRDWKFVVPRALLPELLGALEDTHQVLLAGTSRWARYETEYLDTPERQCFRDHCRGRPHRQKVRFRDYLDRELTMLEVKTRTGRGGTNKLRLERPFADHRLDEQALAFLGEHLRLDPTQLARVQQSSFRRLTLLAKGRPERVTLDLDLRIDGSDALAGVMVLEVKSGLPAPRTLSLATVRQLGIRPGSMSKYVVGTALTQPALPTHQYRMTVRRIRRLAEAA